MSWVKEPNDDTAHWHTAWMVKFVDLFFYLEEGRKHQISNFYYILFLSIIGKKGVDKTPNLIQTWPSRWYMTSPFLPCPQQILNEPSNKTSLSETMKIGISKQFSSPFFLQPFPKGSFILKNYCNSQSVLLSPIWCTKKVCTKVRVH